MELKERILTRRSIRRYRPDPIDPQDMRDILDAALNAPSGLNMQPWYFVAVQSPEAMEQVRSVMQGVTETFRPRLRERFSRHPEQVEITTRFVSTLGGAPACVLAFQLKPDYREQNGVIQSVAAGIENLILAAWDKGIGSCWMTAPVETGYGPELQRRFAPDKGPLMAVIALGYPDQEPKMPPRRDGRYTIV